MSVRSDVLIGLAFVAGGYWLIKTIYQWNRFRRSIYIEIYSSYFEYAFRRKNLVRLSESFYLNNEFGNVDMCFSDDVDSEEWDLNEFNGVLLPVIPVHPLTLETVKGKKRDEIKHALKEEAVKLYEAKEAEFPEPEQLRELERVVLLKCIDSKWMDHIDDMEILRQGIGLAAYGQRDPVVEYKMSAFEMFNNMITSIQEDTLRMLYHVHVEQKIEREQVAKVTGTNKDDSAGPKKPVQRKEIKVYPNDPCPCGSGKKYKQCCGRKNKA